MHVTWLVAALTALLLPFAPAAAMESALTAQSALSVDKLWKRIGDLCGMTAWNPMVDQCVLGVDGKTRRVYIYGSARTFVSELESWDDNTHRFSFVDITKSYAVKNYRATVSVTENGTGSTLTLTATYDADGVADTEAKTIVDRRTRRALCSGGPLLCAPAQPSVSAAEAVEFASLPVNGKSVMLKGYLRRPSGAGPYPAAVLLHGCSGGAELIDLHWGVKLASWGYVTLTVDSFSARGLKNACSGGVPFDVSFDAYRALDFLTTKSFVDGRRAVVLGFSQGGTISLSSVESGGPIEQRKFRAAVAFYPRCAGIKGPMTVPSLILIGERDDWTPADACRKLVNGEDDFGVSRSKGEGAAIELKVFPDAYHAFDVSSIERPITYFSHHLAYNKTAADQASEILQQFLASNVGERP